MGILSDNFGDFGAAPNRVDVVLAVNRPFDLKANQLLRLALPDKAHPTPCVSRHFKGARSAEATEADFADVFALTIHEAAGADDCWIHGVIDDLAGAGEVSSCGGG